MNPHAAKIAKGGEDAFSISSDNRLLSVADGVGGWADSGIDPALYSKNLCKIINNLHETQDSEKYKGNPRDVLIDAASQNNEIGSCTVVVLELDKAEKIVNTVNLGDSGYLWLRKVGLDLIVKFETKS